MRSVRPVCLGLALACVPVLSDLTVNAQEAPPPEPAPVYEAEVVLPEVVVEAAPAKRNVKKETLRKSSGSGQAAAGGQALEQKVVEGEKVLRTLRDTTTSVGIITSQDIAERQIRDLDDAIVQTANVITSEDPNTGFVIRGLNSEGQTGLQHISGVPLIGVVIDGVTQNPDAVRRGARALWDVDQVEVLRGPQSTLQGRNALGGTVIVSTNDPTYKQQVIIEGTAGTNELKSGGFVVNAPIVTGQSALRISGYKTERVRDIYYADPENSEMGEDSYSSLRGKLLIEPDSVPGFSALFSVSRVVDKPGAAFVSGPDFLARELVNSAAFTDFREASANNYVADLSYEFMPGLTLHSITAYARTNTLIKTSAGAQFIRNGDNTDGKDFTQDVRLEIENSGNGLSGVLGLFYGNFQRDAFSNTTLNAPWLGTIPGFESLAPFLPDEIIPYGTGPTVSETTSMAVYADLRYRWDRWVLLGGGRLLRDDVTSSENASRLDLGAYVATLFDPNAPNPYTVIDEDFEAAFNEFLPRIGLTYDLTDNQTIGLTYNKGYRAGFQQLTIDNRITTVDPEFVDTYELSYRSNWLDRTFEFNANAFYNDYTDQQIVVLNEVYTVNEIFNAGSSHSYGAEFEARWRPIAPLQLFATLGLLQSEFDELKLGPTQADDHSGNEYPEAPAFTVSAGGMYRDPAGWFVGADVRHTDGYYSNGNVSNVSTGVVDSYTVVDARVGWEWEKYTLTLFAKNLFDEDYLTTVNTVDGGTLSPAYGFIGDARTVGVTLRGEF
jgi:iron complex outermembrane recepter protein